MERLLRRLCTGIGIFMLGCLLSMTVVMVSLVVTRYAFSYSPAWTEELTRYLMVWLVMLGGAVLVLFDDHIALPFLSDYLGARSRLLQAILIRLIIAAVSALTAWTGFDFAASMWTVRAPGLGIPMFWPTLAIPVSMTLAFCFAVILIVRDASALLTGRPLLSLPRQLDFMDGSFKPAEEEDARNVH